MKLLGERFWSKVHKTSPSGCWIWTGAIRNQFGHGHIMVSNGPPMTFEYAHRLSYQMHVDDLMPGDVIRHRCDNPVCVNPLHLERGSHRDNWHDAMERGRAFSFPPYRGSELGTAKLTESDIPKIRERRAAGETLAAIGAAFSVSRATIGLIVRGKTWTHV